ncbi:MAG: hypothetical protein LBJ35_07230, partial [Spirochaetaceae bacterium]|nr:hypothetical protein [Spirochaetaceae bacterium]
HAAAEIQAQLDIFTQKQYHWGESPWLGTFYNFDGGFIDALRFSFRDVFFYYNEDHSYNATLWTMNGEITGSFLVALVLFCSKYIKSKQYVFWILAAAFLFLVNGVLLAFMLGMAASYLYINKNDFLYKIEKSIPRKTGLFIAAAAAYLAAGLSAYLWVKWAMDLLYSIAAFLLIAFLLTSPLAQRVFSAKFFRFLGKISFPLYIIHVPVLCSFSSFLIVHTNGVGANSVGGGGFSWIFPVLSVIVSQIAACAFYPIEYASVKLSNKLSRVIKTGE